MISVDTLKSIESLSLYPEKSSEAISDQMDTTVPGGELASDSTTGEENNNETNEQYNEFTQETDSNASQSDFGSGSSDFGSGDSFGDDSSNSDSSFGGGGDTFDSGEDKGMTLEPNENPFKVQNGKNILDEMFKKLQKSVTDTINDIHASGKVNPVVISQFDQLMDNIEKSRETIYILPKESTMVKYRSCVKIYTSLCDQVVNEL